MTYLQKEKSSFVPIFMALSIVAAVGFGLMFFFFGKSAATEGESAANQQTPPAAVQTMNKTTHTRV